MELKKMNNVIESAQKTIAGSRLFGLDEPALNQFEVETDGRKRKRVVRELYNLKIIKSTSPVGAYSKNYLINEEEILSAFPGRPPDLVDYFHADMSADIRPQHEEHGIPFNELTAGEKLWVATHPADYSFCLWNQWDGARDFELGSWPDRFRNTVLVSTDEYKEYVNGILRKEKLERLKELNVPWAMEHLLGLSEEEANMFSGGRGRAGFGYSSTVHVGPDPREWWDKIHEEREKAEALIEKLSRKVKILGFLEGRLNEQGFSQYVSEEYTKALKEFMDKKDSDRRNG